MGKIKGRPLTDYIEAFAHYSPDACGLFRTKPFGLHALVKEGEQIYQVSNFEDLALEYASYFDGDATLAYTELPVGLWISILAKQNFNSQDDLIIDLYQSWFQYWKVQEMWYLSKKDHADDKARSYYDFNVLVTQLQLCTMDIFEKAEELNGLILIPIIALALRKQYAYEEDFYRDCVRVMVNQYNDHFGNGEVFVRVGPELGSGSEQLTYFIYSVDG